LIIDPARMNARDVYRFMIDAIVPRPIAFVSTRGPAGGFNVAPFSYFNAIASEPPLVGISINQRKGQPKDTLRNIQDTGDFVVNIVPEALLARMVHASGDWAADVDEFQLTGLTPAPAEIVRAPRVAESPVHFECRLYRLIELGQATLVVGEIARAHADASVVTDGRVDAEKLRPVGRLGGDGYTIVREIVHMARPRVEAPPAKGGGA
jgi:flavin reductase (DIM6/NTAB) family NADH-FMN oxidoreductase RutF